MHVPLNLKLGPDSGENITSFLRQSILVWFSTNQFMPSITSNSFMLTNIRSTLRVQSATVTWPSSTLSLTTKSTPVGVLTDNTCNKVLIRTLFL